VLVRLKAVTLNYRDLLTVKGGYGSRQKFPLVPLSDGAGVVEAVGANVTRLRDGDRVIGSFFEGWLGGEPDETKMHTALGGALDGVLAEYRLFPAHALVKTPEHLTDAEAASLPCAGLTAWSAVVKLGSAKPGQTVLTQGTGGVSVFALQFAKMSGARVIATSSSETKIERLKALGADLPPFTMRCIGLLIWSCMKHSTASPEILVNGSRSSPVRARRRFAPEMT
jgi:NADPH:quinone reductase-like Zn-dependent oxidoreductase